jgi:hypothetical protein
LMLAVGLMAAAGCDGPADEAARGDDEVVAEEMDMTPEELLAAPPAPDCGGSEDCPAASDITQSGFLVGFYAVKTDLRANASIRAFSLDATPKQLASFTTSVTNGANLATKKIKVTYVVGTKKVTVTMTGVATDRTQVNFKGSAGGKKFNFTGDEGGLTAGKPWALSGKTRDFVRAVESDANTDLLRDSWSRSVDKCGGGPLDPWGSVLKGMEILRTNTRLEVGMAGRLVNMTCPSH